MFIQRALVTVILLPIGLWALFAGELSFTTLMAVILGLAAWEFGNLFRQGGYRPAFFVLIAGTVAMTVCRAYAFFGWDWLPLLLGVGLLVAMAVHLVSFERGNEKAAIDLLATFGGFVYIGVLGSYFVALRDLPDGIWWLLIVLTAVWWADLGAYFIGSLIGKHKLVPRLSPNKTWEGYLSGIAITLLGSPLLLKLYQALDLPVPDEITLPRVLLIALIMGVVPTMGDLGISLFKRTFGVKNTGRILPGHGGMLDRIDSWLWGIPIGYYLITLLFI